MQTQTTGPTAKQLNYLRALASRSGTTFAAPRTRREASGEIARMKRVLARSGTYREVPRGEDERVHYATAPAKGEVHGRGAEASWRKPGVATTPRPRRKRALLACYEADGARRALYAERALEGGLRLVDRPASGGGRAYLIDRDLEPDGAAAIRALAADYVDKAKRLGRIPMARA